MRIFLKGVNRDDGGDVEVEYSGSGGGSASGESSILGPFDLAFNTDGLSDGVEVYTPSVGDFLRDIIVVVTTAWDGANPAKLDFGIPDSFGNGFYKFILTNEDACDMTQAVFDPQGDGDVLLSSVGHSLLGATIGQTGGGSVFQNGPPFFVTSETPWKVWVSQDGTMGGDDPASATGSAKLYLDIVTPVAFE